ncbi:MAG: nucleotide sugar dehydrogenase, partial [Candidatus Andersenbacteria bacterium]|nr:nucleotide sugar dehydrogenase [Candidatus Andersenbacteria bacterium]
DEETLEVLSEVYGAMTSAGVFKATSIQVAESAKVIENIQRDVNIALMNELKMIFDKLDIDVQDVLAASETKWNFLPFYPGLVGGHCIGVDPYYLAQKATEIGVHPQMILSGRRINDEMPHYHAGQVVKDMIERELTVKGANVCVLGATFKPDVPDLRNSKVEDLVRDLSSFGCNVTICEPEFPERAEIFGCKTVSVPEVMTTQFEYVVRAVNHEVFSKLAVHYTIGASSAERAAKQAEQSRTMRTVSDTTEPVSA